MNLLSALGLCGLFLSSIQQSVRFVPPPTVEDGRAKELIDKAERAVASGKSAYEILTDDEYLGIHKWKRFRVLVRENARPAELTIVTSMEPGRRLDVIGHVTKAAGQPAANELVYVYQTSSKGWYSDGAPHIGGNEGDRKHARLFGYLKTDNQGNFKLHTIRPVGYPDSDLPAHIHIEIDGGTGRLITELQFDDDPRLTADWRQRSRKEGFLIGKVVKDAGGKESVSATLKLP